MQPIFKEMIQMWNDLGYPLPIEEGKYWLENHFVCGFTANGELHKLYKYKVADDLSIEITPYKVNKIKLLLGRYCYRPNSVQLLHHFLCHLLSLFFKSDFLCSLAEKITFTPCLLAFDVPLFMLYLFFACVADFTAVSASSHN